MSVEASTPNACAICVRSSPGVDTLTSIFFLRAPCSASTLKAKPLVDVEVPLRGELPLRGDTGLGSTLALLVEPNATRETPGGAALGGGLRFTLKEPGVGVGEVLDAAGLEATLGMLGGVGRGAEVGIGGVALAVEFNTGFGALLKEMPFADALRRANASRSASDEKGDAGPERSAGAALEAPDDGSTLVGSERCGMPVAGIGGGGGAGPPLPAPNAAVGAPSGDLGAPNGGGEVTAGAPTFGGAFFGAIFAIPAFLGAFLGGGGGALAAAGVPKGDGFVFFAGATGAARAGGANLGAPLL